MVPGHISFCCSSISPTDHSDAQVLTFKVSKESGWRGGRDKKSKGLSVTRSLTPHY